MKSARFYEFCFRFSWIIFHQVFESFTSGGEWRWYSRLRLKIPTRDFIHWRMITTETWCLIWVLLNAELVAWRNDLRPSRFFGRKCLKNWSYKHVTYSIDLKQTTWTVSILRTQESAADAILEVLLSRFINPYRQTANRSAPCDNNDRSDPCETFFVLCAVDKPFKNPQDCSYGFYQTNVQVNLG